jgi:phosphoribosyl-ATP pyrophosphohydrolase
MLEDLYAVLRERKETRPTGSYTVALLDQGNLAITRKVGEEALEVVLAATSEDRERLVEEIGDLLYHVLVLMVENDIALEDLSKELTSRQVSR